MRKTGKKILSVVVAICMGIATMPMMSIPVSAETYPGICGAVGNEANVQWSLNTDTKTLTITGTGAMTDYEDPSSAPWYDKRGSIETVTISSGVTSIGKNAFFHHFNLTQVTISDSVTSIGWSAFIHCGKLSKITIPSSVTSIGAYAFMRTGLKNITLEDGFQKISSNIFQECESLKNITIPASVTSISDWAFSGCSSLEIITFLGTTPPAIGANAFYNIKSSGEIIYPDKSNGYINTWLSTINLSGWTLSAHDSGSPPAVKSISPADHASATNINGSIVVTFDEAMNTSAGTVSLSSDSGPVNTTGSWSTTTSANDTFTIDYSGLAYNTPYTIKVENFKDVAGNVMDPNSEVCSFTTKEQPEGPIVSPTTLNLDLYGNSTGTLNISLGQPDNRADQVEITIDNGYENDISIAPATLADDGTVTVTGLQVVSGAGITVIFSGSTATPTNIPITVNITDSTPPPAIAHTITVLTDGNGTATADKTTAFQGETVALTATRASSNYYFSHWEVVSGGTVLSGNSFVMPDNDVAVKAHFSRYSSGGNDSDNSSTPTVTIPPAAQPDQPTIGSISGKVAGPNTQRTFTITDGLVKTALEKAQAEAKAQNRTAYGIGVQLVLDTPATAGLTVTFERATLNRLVSVGAKQLEITGAPISLTLDAKALAELQKQSVGNVTITIKPVTVKGIRHAYDISFSYVKNGKTANITSLGTGTATLSIPFTPAKGEAAGGFYAVYVDDKGKANRFSDSSYDANSGSVIFSTDHFSVYGVGYTAPSEKFTDMAKHWAAESLDYVVGRGLLSGTTTTTFAPDTAMTRGMLVTALGRLAGVDIKTYITNSFTDVKADSAFRPYIEWAYKKGIVQGTGNSKFEPDRAVTREEIAVIFANYAKATGYTLPVTRTTTTYADASSIGGTYKTAVTAMQQAGIMMGGTGNKFNPKASATRAEVSSMLHRYVKLTIDPATAQGWAKNDAGQYLYYKDGKALTGAQTINGVKHYFNTDGTLKTGWLKDDSGNWHFYSGNILLVGWWDIGANGNNKRYYFDTYGNMISGKWLQIDGKWYYFYDDGSLARSTKIDEYEVDENGVRKNK